MTNGDITGPLKLTIHISLLPKFLQIGTAKVVDNGTKAKEEENAKEDGLKIVNSPKISCAKL
jgi:hypothetical protein